MATNFYQFFVCMISRNSLRRNIESNRKYNAIPAHIKKQIHKIMDEWFCGCPHSIAMVLSIFTLFQSLISFQNCQWKSLLSFVDVNGKNILKIEFLHICAYENIAIQKNILIDVSIHHYIYRLKPGYFICNTFFYLCHRRKFYIICLPI